MDNERRERERERERDDSSFEFGSAKVQTFFYRGQEKRSQKRSLCLLPMQTTEDKRRCF